MTYRSFTAAVAALSFALGITASMGWRAVAGGPGQGLTVEVRNPPAAGAEHAVPLPGAGTGLVGLRERVGLGGGQLDSGWTTDGDFRLRATLPWPA